MSTKPVWSWSGIANAKSLAVMVILEMDDRVVGVGEVLAVLFPPQATRIPVSESNKRILTKK